VPRAVSLVVPGCWADKARTAAHNACAMVGLEARLVSSGLATAVGALLPSKLDGCGPIAVRPLAERAPAVKGGGEAQLRGGPAKAINEAVGDGEGALVLVLTGGRDYLEASLVRVTKRKAKANGKAAGSDDGVGDDGGNDDGDGGDDDDDDEEEEEKEEGGGSLKGAGCEELAWVGRVQVECARGAAAAGLADAIADAAPEAAAALARGAASYENHGAYSKDHGANGKDKAGSLAAVLATLLCCVDECLVAHRARTATRLGAAQPVVAVLARGALFGAFGAVLEAPLRAHMAANAPLLTPAAQLWVLPADCAVRGAAALAAAINRLPRSAIPHKLAPKVCDSAPRCLALAHAKPFRARMPEDDKADDWTWGVDEVDELCARDAPLPLKVERTVNAAVLKTLGLAPSVFGKPKLCFTVVEAREGEFRRRFERMAPLGDVLVRSHGDTLEAERGVKVTLVFSVCASGLLTISTKDFVSEKEDDLLRHNAKPWVMRNLGRILMGLVLVVLLGAQGWAAHDTWRKQQSAEAYRHAARHAALAEFYRTVNPEKLEGIDEALAAHKGHETALWKKLEKKYGRRPPRPEYLKYSTKTDL